MNDGQVSANWALAVMGRAPEGVCGIRLMKGDEVVAAEVAESKTAILTVAENGFGRRTRIEDYPLTRYIALRRSWTRIDLGP